MTLTQFFCIIAFQSMLALNGHISCAFTLNPLATNVLPFRKHPASPYPMKKSRKTTLFQSSSSDIFVLSYDGVVADTNLWRANLAINVALQTWPHLQESMTDDNDWLMNKLFALLPVTYSGSSGMMGCDAVLLARLLLEEQALDEGKSNGCKGKYGSKFHPSSKKKVSGIEEQGGSKQGSRPLTVGEITANWNDGACLKDTVRIKYNVDRMDPIPVIERHIRDYLEKSDITPDVHPSISDALLDCSGQVYIIVGDKSHVTTAMSSLSHISMPLQMMDWKGDGKLDNELKTGITIIPPGGGGRGHEGILQHILMSVEKGSLVHLIHSNVATLQEAKKLFGDNRPRPGMFEKIGMADASLKLSFFSLNTGPQELNEATMDPWLNVVDEFELVESLSCRIITK